MVHLNLSCLHTPYLMWRNGPHRLDPKQHPAAHGAEQVQLQLHLTECYRVVLEQVLQKMHIVNV